MLISAKVNTISRLSRWFFKPFEKYESNWIISPNGFSAKKKSKTNFRNHFQVELGTWTQCDSSPQEISHLYAASGPNDLGEIFQ